VVLAFVFTLFSADLVIHFVALACFIRACESLQNGFVCYKSVLYAIRKCYQLSETTAGMDVEKLNPEEPRKEIFEK
jgi:hypothetical protein